ncbi:hypothetical protein Y032_0273g972 [Ancylostoma ceylanicum]|uniref:Sec7 domain protein n=1 Tax=Ancylostoma ceylanicum TaxID=53326 RepID=A0A016S8S6_9BILA|nr:hypothetical protein Y032_0273g972 [Ancylostoma ceylanicum]
MAGAFNPADLTEEELGQLRGLRKRKMELMDEIEHIKNELRDVDAELESLYYVDEGSRSRHKLIFTGKKKFNQDPMRGIEYLTDRGLLSRQPSAVAQWLYKGEGLSKTAIGELLGSHDPFCLEVLDQFVLCHNFQNMFIVDALRAFLWSFRLPGESQKIDRIMERFAQQYVATNEGVFDNADTCFTIAYSCIMLNTLLHNPNVKDRPTFERYQNMNKELLDAGSVNTAILAQIFDSIRAREFQIPCEDAARLDNIFLHPDREGWLYKQSSSQFISGPLSWKRRWFVLSDSCLYYFDQTGEKEPRGIIPLQNVGVRRVESASRPFMFEIFSLSEDGRIKACKTEQTGKLVEGRHSVYRICASGSDDLNAWLEAIAGAASISLHDVRWQSGAIEELNAKIGIGEEQQEVAVQVYEEFDPFEALNAEGEHKCTACGWSLDEEDRDAVIGHYRSQWHRYNAKHMLKGRKPLTEDEFEELGEEERKADELSSSSSDSDDSDCEDVPLKLGSSHVHFIHNNEVFSMYKCLLRPGETSVSLSMFARPLDCAIFLLAGGHFAAGVFKGDKMVSHKAFHRYVVRAKQGGVQSANDNAKGPARSAGAALRRYNERALREDIVKVMQDWAENLAATPLVFIRCASYQKVIFHEVDEGGFERKDPRLRTIPFETKRPLIDEVRRVWEKLGSVTCHGTLEEFMAERSRRKQRMKNLVKKKRVDDHWNLDDVKEKEKSPSKEKKTDHLKPVVPQEEKPKEVDRWPTLDKNKRRELYTMIKGNNDEELAALVKEHSDNDQNEVIDYLLSFRLSDGSTFLHLAAKNSCDKIVKYLLEIGCDPCIKNEDDMVAYALSPSKLLKQVFIQFRSENADRWNWIRSHIPEPVQMSEEQIAKLAEKKKEKKQKQKEKAKIKKEAEKKEAEELAARTAFLAMSDREKRAAAAEARLAKLSGGPRCVQCGVAYTGSGFEYNELRFCSPACVALHRRGLTSS